MPHAGLDLAPISTVDAATSTVLRTTVSLEALPATVPALHQAPNYAREIIQAWRKSSRCGIRECVEVAGGEFGRLGFPRIIAGRSHSLATGSTNHTDARSPDRHAALRRSALRVSAATRCRARGSRSPRARRSSHDAYQVPDQLLGRATSLHNSGISSQFESRVATLNTPRAASPQSLPNVRVR
jgi:hypothetical protein